MSRGLRCPRCEHEASDVLDSRAVVDAVRRRRRCCKCGFRWTTLEILGAKAIAAERLLEVARLAVAAAEVLPDPKRRPRVRR